MIVTYLDSAIHNFLVSFEYLTCEVLRHTTSLFAAFIQYIVRFLLHECLCYIMVWCSSFMQKFDNDLDVRFMFKI